MMFIWVKIVQTELKVKIYSKSLVRVIGKVFSVLDMLTHLTTMLPVGSLSGVGYLGLW